MKKEISVSTNQYSCSAYSGAMLTYTNPLTPREFPPHQDPSSASVYTNSCTITHQNGIFVKKLYPYDTVFKQNSEAGAILLPSYEAKHFRAKKSYS